MVLFQDLDLLLHLVKDQNFQFPVLHRMQSIFTINPWVTNGVRDRRIIGIPNSFTFKHL